MSRSRFVVNFEKYSRRKFPERSLEIKCARQQPTCVARKLGKTIQDENVRSCKGTTKTSRPLCSAADKNSLNSGYLERHTHIDEEQHAPMGQKLLRNICDNDSLKWRQAVNAANNALQARHCLWDGINQSIQQ
ncbi:DUF3050 domain-containing protein [Microcoleus sp. Pol10_D6]|uniref:DUF3050 domain-containing protein n=1 Tax=Microcoleus sp. Pol10_D6 TaxID=2818875 RepID=UPI002FD1778A